MTNKPSKITKKLPFWDISTIYKNFDDPEFMKDIDTFSETVKNLSDIIMSDRAIDTQYFHDILHGFDRAEKIFENLNSYCYAAYSTDTGNSRNIKELNSLEKKKPELLKARFLLINTLDTSVIKKAAVQPELEDYSLFFAELLEMKKHLLSEDEEELLNQLVQPGANAWSRLQESVSSAVSAVWDEKSGEEKTATELRNLAFDPDRETRKKAFEKEISCWKQMEIPLAYALNGVKGFNNIINSKKNWDSSFKKSLFQARMESTSVNTMISAMEKSLPVFRRYLKLKARALGLEKLAFFDLFAPLYKGDSNKVWSFTEGKEFILKTFYSFSEDFGSFAEKAFKKNWIDAFPRKGKTGGAYCTSFPLRKESRVLANFNGSFSSVSTIAHELGHAYHFEILKNESHFHQDYPMTLAETASIFSEILIFNRAIEDSPAGEKGYILEIFLQEITQVIVDILSRFYFEEAVFRKREEGELTPDEFSSLMEEAQERTYGEALDKNYYHKYMWAVKGHYYIPSLSFYNYPYAFGQLFGIALFNSYQEKKDEFPEKYTGILRATGKKSVENIALDAGFRLDSEDFWLGSIKYIENLVEIFSDSLNSKEN